MGIKRVKLNYQPIAKRKSDEIAFVVSKNHLNAVNQSIHNKIVRNRWESINSLKDAKDYHVGSISSEAKTGSLVKSR